MNCKNVRLKLKLTQSEMAKVLGYSDKSRISEIENGRWGSLQTARMIDILSFFLEKDPDLIKKYIDIQLKTL